MIASLKHIFFYKEQSYTIRSEERTIEDSFLVISVANGTRYGGGFHVAPLAKADDGLLDVNLVKKLPVLKRLRYLPVIEKGKHLALPFVDYFNTKKISISSEQLMQVHLDGEYLETKELMVEILPAHFNFIY
jgi:diacylglycerol kinase (ATP)